MKILVAIKRVIDFKVSVRLKQDQSEIETNNVKMSMNPFDEIAVEEALRIKEKGLATDVIVVSIGSDACQETLRTALAMGADRAYLVRTSLTMPPLELAKILKKIAEQESPSLIMLGKQAIDSDDNQVGQMLAGLLNWPQGTFVSQLVFHETGIRVTREVDGGLETLSLKLPAVVTTDLRLNEPRYMTLPNIVQSKRKPLTLIEAETLVTCLEPRVKVLSVALSKQDRRKVRVEHVADLVQCLQQAGYL
ncbi:MAG: hypothetical protein ACD_45C00706G0001 [uncultured bacterium]|nr:MAG: hypothetical protein ACD_45C00706G0001 [uncultured bacterium]OGT59035.1 MAG: electron transfer flavoprotein subunit beta [Gammaproteobacteria bacterium RIFCSPHIGHO2_12_FULL_42_10]